jgi:hypothetical protein
MRGRGRKKGDTVSKSKKWTPRLGEVKREPCAVVHPVPSGMRIYVYALFPGTQSTSYDRLKIRPKYESHV